jgi:NADH dehydrogenase [ubiquinone] 1 alpha subcomplex assembly factor 7
MNTAALTPLDLLIRQHLRHAGSISLSQFLALALQHPQHGYYRQAPAIGAEGDFITAPEISGLFGESLAIWLVQAWQAMGQPPATEAAPCQLIEFGGGRGVLMADVLRALHRLAPAMVAYCQVHLVESDSLLRAQQQHRLAAYSVTWHEDWQNLPHFNENRADSPIWLIANEFLDALPADQMMRQHGQWFERRIALAEAEAEPQAEAKAKAKAKAKDFAPPAPATNPDTLIPLRFIAIPVDSIRAQLLQRHYPDCPEGGVVELSSSRQVWVQEVASLLHRRGGGGLIIDYGTPRPDWLSSLQAYGHHQQVDPLRQLGMVDLSVAVNWHEVVTTLSPHAAVTPVLTSQADFLRQMGILQRLGQLPPAGQQAEQAGVDRLLADPGMGQAFQVLTLLSQPQA